MKPLFAAMVMLAGGTAATAQEFPPPCYDVASADSFSLEMERPIFFEEDDEDGVYAELREHLGIQKLAADAPAEAITDPAVCEDWLPDILRAIQTSNGPHWTTEGFRFELLRFGPYLAVIGGLAPDPRRPEMCLHTPTFIFEMRTRRYLGKLGI